MNLEPQPSNRALRDALYQAQRDPKSIEVLRTLRTQRTTWFDTPELELRRKIDEALQ